MSDLTNWAATLAQNIATAFAARWSCRRYFAATGSAFNCWYTQLRDYDDREQPK